MSYRMNQLVGILSFKLLFSILPYNLYVLKYLIRKPDANVTSIIANGYYFSFRLYLHLVLVFM